MTSVADLQPGDAFATQPGECLVLAFRDQHACLALELPSPEAPCTPLCHVGTDVSVERVELLPSVERAIRAGMQCGHRDRWRRTTYAASVLDKCPWAVGYDIGWALAQKRLPLPPEAG